MIISFCGYLLLSILSLSMTKLFAQDSCESNNLEDDPDNNVSKLVSFLEFVGKLCQEGMKQKTFSGSPNDEHRSTCSLHPMDCGEIYHCGEKQSGMYRIWPRSRIVEGPVNAFCDMDTDGGGWTVIQRRGDFGHAKDYFYNGWQKYKEGFGDVRQDFWLGNDLLFAITNQRPYSLRFDLKDLEDKTRYAIYDNFWIDSEDYNYTLHVKGYSGNAGDGFNDQADNQFSTKDRDNDRHETANCSAVYKGAWWYGRCHSSNLNGLYLNGTHISHADGVNWTKWKGNRYSLSFTEMKIRHTFYIKSEESETSITPSK